MAPPHGESEWHLYNLREGPEELTNRAADEPEKFAEMKDEWAAYAASVGYIEAGDTKQLDCMSPEEFFRYDGLT